MTPALTPLRGKRISWTTMLGLVLVPLTVAGLFLWGCGTRASASRP